MNVKKMYERAEAAIGLKKYDLAVSIMKDVISSNPNYSYAYYLTAKAYFWIGDYDKSEEYIRQALSFCATNNDYLIQLSATLIFNKKYEEALENIDNALASEPTNSLAIYYKAYCLYKKEEYKRAENILLWYLEDYPNDDLAHSVLGGIYRDLGNLNLAEKEFQEALRLNPNDATTFNNYSLVYENNNNEKTLELLKEAIRLNPTNEIIESNYLEILSRIKFELPQKDKLYKFCLWYKSLFDEWQIQNAIAGIAPYYFLRTHKSFSISEFSQTEIIIISFAVIFLALLAIMYQYATKHIENFDKELEHKFN